MGNNDLQENDQLISILTTITNAYNKDKLQSNELQIVSSYVDTLIEEPRYLIPLSRIRGVKAIEMILAYGLAFKNFAGLGMEFFKCDFSKIKQIITPDKDLKITFVQLNGWLSIVLYTEQDKIYYLYVGEDTFMMIDQSEFDTLKGIFESGGGLKDPLNDYIRLQTGELKNTETVTIPYSKHFDFSAPGVNEPQTVLLYPAINTDRGVQYPHKLTLVMLFEYNTSLAVEFHDTFQICPPDGCK